MEKVKYFKETMKKQFKDSTRVLSFFFFLIVEMKVLQNALNFLQFELITSLTS
jgi:hypothetical protein